MNFNAGNMSAKKWCVVFISLCVFTAVTMASFNILFDPNGYFSKKWDKIYGSEINSRYIKLNYIKGNPSLYSGFILGGSRTARLDPNIPTSLSGIRFYNMSYLIGFIEDSEGTVNFLLNNTNVKHIVVSLHGEEVYSGSSYFNLYEFDGKYSTKLKEIKEALFFPVTEFVGDIVFRREPRIMNFNPNDGSWDGEKSLNYIDTFCIPEFIKT